MKIWKNSKPSEVAESAYDPRKDRLREVTDKATGRLTSEAYDPRTDDEIDHDAYVAAIIHAFNPPDGDGAQASLLLHALDQAHALIVAQPCTCPEPDEYGYRVPPCTRCSALGRSGDEVISR